jgi:hypothetical protein
LRPTTGQKLIACVSPAIIRRVKLRDLNTRARAAAYATGAVFVGWLIAAPVVDAGPVASVGIAAAIGVIGGAVIQAVGGRGR